MVDKKRKATEMSPSKKQKTNDDIEELLAFWLDNAELNRELSKRTELIALELALEGFH